MNGIGKLYVNDVCVCIFYYHRPYARKEKMDKITKLYSLKNKEYYWQIIPPDVSNRPLVRNGFNGKITHNLNKISK